MSAAVINLDLDAAGVGALFGLLGVLVTLWVNGDRAERQRRRDLHARALAAVLAYGEMPFMVRRRRPEEEGRSGERVRLSNQFSEVQAEVATCQVLLRADGDNRLAEAYHNLVRVARETAGREAHEAWNEEPIAHDPEMNMRGLFNRLRLLRDELERFQAQLAHATLPRRLKLWRALRKRG